MPDKTEVTTALEKYDAIGSWWSYKSDKVPCDVKIIIAGTVNEFDRVASHVCQSMYRDCKPRQTDYRSIKDWG